MKRNQTVQQSVKKQNQRKPNKQNGPNTNKMIRKETKKHIKQTRRIQTNKYNPSALMV